MEKVTIELSKEDLINLIKGTGGPNDYIHPFGYLGEITGFPNEKWYWNEKALDSFPVWRLQSIYNELKEFNSKS